MVCLQMYRRFKSEPAMARSRQTHLTSCVTGFHMDRVLEGARRSGGHLQNPGEGQLGADGHLEKCIHCVHHASEGSVVVLGPFASGNVSTRQNLLLGLALLSDSFTEKQGTQSAIHKSLLFASKSGPFRLWLRHSSIGKLSHGCFFLGPLIQH